MHADSIYVLNIKTFLGFQKVKEDSSFMHLSKITIKPTYPRFKLSFGVED